MKPILISTIFVLIYLNTAYSLRCSKCDYTNYLDCHDTISCRPQRNEKMTCYKFVVKDGLGNEKFKKGCERYVEYPTEACQFHEDTARAFNQRVVGCFVCEYDGCNSGHRMGNTIATVLITNVLVLLYWRLL